MNNIQNTSTSLNHDQQNPLNMQSLLKQTRDPVALEKVRSAKHNYGLLYGAIAGLAFAVAVWGFDDYSLSQAHALFPWLKFIVGAIICILVGALAGRLSAQFEKVYATFLTWLIPLALFAWLSLVIPFSFAPSLTTWLRPDLKGLLNYVYYPDFQYRFGLSLALALIFGSLVGLLQPMLTESAVFSNSSGGKLISLVVCIVLMGLSGIWIDNFNNEPLRSAVVSMNETIQYALDHQGQQVDPKVARQMHLSTINSVADLINRPRRLVVSSYNNTLGEINLLVEFDNIPVHCVVVYAQPAFCERVTSSAP